MRRMFWLAAAVAGGMAGGAGAVSAQSVDAAAEAPAASEATSPVPFPARIDRFGETRDEVRGPVTVDAAAQLGRPVTLMIVGGALLVAGAVIDDDVGTLISVTGIIIGVYGLYLFLR